MKPADGEEIAGLEDLPSSRGWADFNPFAIEGMRKGRSAMQPR